MRRDLQYLKEHANGSFYYLATPYSHPEKAIREKRAHDANVLAGWLMSHGLYVYSPIWNCHRCAVSNNLPTDFEWWMKFNEAFIDPAAGVIVAQMDGWDTSRGISHEIAYTREEFPAKPLVFMRAVGPLQLELRFDDEFPIVE